MQNRRTFIKNSGSLLLGSLAVSGGASSLFSSGPTHPVGVQLFTFFNSIDNDVAGTLKKIAAVGYKEIESAFSRKGGYYGLKAKEFAALVKESGMSWKSHHTIGAPFKMPPNAKPPVDANGKPISIPPMRNLKDNYQELIDEVAEAGIPYLVCASTPITTLDEVKGSIEVLNKAGEAAKKAGITLAYHNHDKEFVAVEGQKPYDVFLKQSTPDNLKFELDLAWATKAGVDIVELFKQNSGRFPLLHVKDIDKDGKIQPVGNGIVDFKNIFANAKVAGVQHYFVEHDMPADAIASITTSYGNLEKLLG